MFCQGPSQGHFNPRLAALAKMSPSSGPEHIYACEHNKHLMTGPQGNSEFFSLGPLSRSEI